MNIGIILGVSEYFGIANNLPGCHYDAEIINEILAKTNKYDDILYINEKLGSAVVKEKITDFVSSHKNDNIDELLFYYTGHGEFYNGEFYFILSDFDNQKRKQTTLQNDEVDNLIKTLNPGLVVKIIDACQSGKSYVKEANGINKYFEKTQGHFKRCYFLNSSLNDQNSFQSDTISEFTKSFINSIKNHKSTEIRYKDIIDFISDEFEGNPAQTPYFVIQADYTEKFCTLNKSLKQYLDTMQFNVRSDIKDLNENFTLLDKIKNQAQDYSGKDEALQLISKLRVEISKLSLDSELASVFDLNISFYEDYEQIERKNVIGKWLNENAHDYFAEAKYKRVRKDRHTNPFGSLQTVHIFGQQNDKEYEWIMNGFDLDVEVPYKTIVLDLISKFPNVESFTLRIVYLLSKKKIAFFYFVTDFEEKNWEKVELNANIEWLHIDYPITKADDVFSGLMSIFNSFQEKIKNNLNEKFEMKE
ncbi:MAG: caspase family protein [Saprospiraceae bacterium]|uniref:Caspase family protein n=1 Tax=Candidatus Opimibacter skivensis TaxID=2982028 RepID=A0A9D7SXS8_9BACT|nr:caspase family protein [Candidatus Opimibacter skivensis]